MAKNILFEFYINMKIAGFYNYNNYNSPSFKSVKFTIDGKGIKTPQNLKLKTDIGEVKVVSEPQTYNEHIFYLDNYKTNYDNGKLVKGVGRESLSINPKSKYINGNVIRVNHQYQKKHKFGEILRLVSIMEMMENDILAINIQSMPEAVVFHSKYKFVPDLDEYSVDELLDAVSKNSVSKLSGCKAEAKHLREEIKRHGLWKRGDEYLNRANDLTQKYLDLIIENKIQTKPEDFGEGFCMELTRGRVLENKDYFNELFKKHGIDYEIG